MHAAASIFFSLLDLLLKNEFLCFILLIRIKRNRIDERLEAMLAEVTAWKEKLEAMKNVADSYGTEQKEKILPLIGQLEQEVVTAQMRVQKLETECPSDWSPMKNELDDLFGTIGSSVDRAWRDLSPGEVGG
jgi:hypothetical protein